MPWKYTDEYYTQYTRETWNQSAADYVELMRNLAPFRSDVLSHLDPRPGERILDLGTGPGEPALTIARAIGSHGRVTGVDLSENMIRLAREAATARGVGNADFRVMDCSRMGFEDSVFDAAISCFGFQIFTNPEEVAKEVHRVLRAGGRLFATVWSTGDKVPWLDVIVGPMVEHAEPDETGYIPTPYETGGPGEMSEFLESAGFRDSQEWRIVHDMQYRDEDAYLRTILKATPLGHSLSEEPPETQAEILSKTRANLRKWVTPEGLRLPAECVVVGARRP